MSGRVDQLDAHAIALCGPDGGTGNPAVVGPRRKEDSGRDLDLLVNRDELVLAHRATGGVARDLSGIEVGEDLHRVEAVAGVIDPTHRAQSVAPQSAATPVLGVTAGRHGPMVIVSVTAAAVARGEQLAPTNGPGPSHGAGDTEPLEKPAPVEPAGP
jgi:hypothetical protein